ncbi:MAG: flagellar basal body rod protein FlgB [Lachnospiraceae bacterium]|nr:flagellar basal body rod protein FlgB [Lachnospiraceae bacterium]
MGLFVNSEAFDYINVLDKAADGSWRRNELITNNIANADTPTYKRQDIDFETALRQELRNTRYQTMDSKVRHANQDLGKLNAQPYEDMTAYSYRLDGNNVDPEQENVELASNQIKYSGIMDGIKNEFTNLQSVMRSGS